MAVYCYMEPDEQGNPITVYVTDAYILKIMKEKYQDFPTEISDTELIEEFLAVNWAWEVGK